MRFSVGLAWLWHLSIRVYVNLISRRCAIISFVSSCPDCNLISHRNGKLEGHVVLSPVSRQRPVSVQESPAQWRHVICPWMWCCIHTSETSVGLSVYMHAWEREGERKRKSKSDCKSKCVRRNERAILEHFDTNYVHVAFEFLWARSICG